MTPVPRLRPTVMASPMPGRPTAAAPRLHQGYRPFIQLVENLVKLPAAPALPQGANTAHYCVLLAVAATWAPGIGNLVDADMATESAQLNSLQVKQQLGVQALSIANSAPSIALKLFGG